jgi:homocysteine S-methyltransferase
MKDELKKIDIPFGFKINAFKEIPFGWKPDATNPNEVLGKDTDITIEKFLNISQQLADLGSKIMGGCCEITPKHISELKKIKC